jgi:anti-anti-sigma regulatory factor
MELTIDTAPGKPNVSIIALSGDLDASNYLDVISRGEALYKRGVRAAVLDLSNTDFVSSSGLVAIHSLALILQGEAPPNPDEGWAAIRSMKGGSGNRARECLKLVNPRPRVAGTLDKVGFTEVLEVYPSVDAAVAAL